MDAWRDHHRQVLIVCMERAFRVSFILCKQSSHPRIPHVKCFCNALSSIGTYDNLTWLRTLRDKTDHSTAFYHTYAHKYLSVPEILVPLQFVISFPEPVNIH